MRDREIKEKVNKEIKIILAGKSVEGGKIGKKTGLTGGEKVQLLIRNPIKQAS